MMLLGRTKEEYPKGAKQGELRSERGQWMVRVAPMDKEASKLPLS